MEAIILLQVCLFLDFGLYADFSPFASLAELVSFD